MELKELLSKSARIIITSHISPDVDAVCSSLLLGRTLTHNFSDKPILITLEEQPTRDLSFLAGYDGIKFGNLYDRIEQFKPDLMILVDVSSLVRCSRDERISQVNLETVVIDHHNNPPNIAVSLYVNEGRSSATQQVYELCFKKLGLDKPDGYADTTMLGILSDTNRFKYADAHYRETFQVVSELIEAGANIEELENRLERYNKQQLEVLAHLIENLRAESGYSYSYISDDFAINWQRNNLSVADYKAGCDVFVNQYIRNLDDNQWGFIIYPDLNDEKNSYSSSFRSVSGMRDVSELARKLGGGGHREAAGAKNIRAQTVEEAVETVRHLIE